MTRGRVLVFLDEDCTASPTWLEAVVNAVHANPRVWAGGQTIHPTPDNSIVAAGQLITDAVNDFFNPAGKDVRFLPGLNLALNQELFLAIGGCAAEFGRLVTGRALLAWPPIPLRPLEPCIPSRVVWRRQNEPWFTRVELPPPVPFTATAPMAVEPSRIRSVRQSGVRLAFYVIMSDRD